MRNDDRKYIIYDHISPTGKHYIGQTCCELKKRFGKAGNRYLAKTKNGYKQPAFASAIIKYGWDNFQHNILFSNLSELEANMVEEDLVYYYRKQGLSYNTSPGGSNHIPTEETRNKLSEIHKGKHLSEEHKKRISESKLNGSLSKRVVQMSKDGSVIKVWPSMMEIERELGYCASHIGKCCNNKPKYKTAYGYVWKYDG